ncbi:MAG: holo-ACP synthase [Nitrospinota bacterium]
MIVGTGIDIVKNNRFEVATKKWGKRFLSRIFSKQEIEYAFKKKNPFPSLSARFAGKEAFSKALGTGFSSGIRMKDIEVIKNPGKPPALELHGRALSVLHEKGVLSVHLSLSHESEYSVASVILTGMTPGSSEPHL